MEKGIWKWKKTKRKKSRVDVLFAVFYVIIILNPVALTAVCCGCYRHLGDWRTCLEQIEPDRLL